MLLLRRFSLYLFVQDAPHDPSRFGRVFGPGKRLAPLVDYEPSIVDVEQRRGVFKPFIHKMVRLGSGVCGGSAWTHAIPRWPQPAKMIC